MITVDDLAGTIWKLNLRWKDEGKWEAVHVDKYSALFVRIASKR